MGLLEDQIAQTLTALGIPSAGVPAPEMVQAPEPVQPLSFNEATQAAAGDRAVMAEVGRTLPPTIQEGPADLMTPKFPSPDALAAERDTVSNPTVDLTTGTAGYDPNEPPYTPNSQPATLGEASRMADDQLAVAAKAKEDSDSAALTAQTAQATRLADARLKEAEEQGVLNQSYQTTRKAIEAKADADMAQWIDQMQWQAKREPNPARWWSSQSNMGKAIWALGLVFGAAHKAITPGAENVALQMVQSLIRDDIATQKDVIGREGEVLKTRGKVQSDKNARAMADANDDYAAALQRLNALGRAWEARAVVPGDEDAAATKAAAHAWLEQQKAPILEGRRREKVEQAERQAAQDFQAAQAKLARSHAAWQAKLDREFRSDEAKRARAFEEGQNALDRQLKRDLAPIDVKAGFAPGANPIGKDGLPVLREVQSGVGVRGANGGLILKGPDGKPANGTGILRVREDKQLQEASALRTAANQKYTTTKKVLDLLEKRGDSWTKNTFGMAAGVADPELNALLKEMGFVTAKSFDPGGRLSNQDFSAGLASAMGFDANGNWLDRAKFFNNIPEIKEKLRKDLADMPAHVTASFRDYNDGAINGQGTELVWDPEYLVAPEGPPEKNTADLRGEAPPTLEDINTKGQGKVTSAKDYEARAATEAADVEQRGTLLPKHDAQTVRDVIARTRGAGPETIKRIGDEAVKAINAARERTDSPDEKARLDATHNIVRNVTNAEAKKAEKVIERVRGRAKFGKLTWGASDESIRKMAKEEGLQDNAEVVKLIEEFRNFAPGR